MLYTVTSDQITPLAGHLGGLLSTPLEDPFASEWIAVPTSGMQRWLSLELAKSLGASRPDLHDGVATNLGITFPGTLRRAFFNPQGIDDENPWEVERLVWTTLSVLLEERANSALETVVEPPEGTTWFSRARQIADLFDRYSTRRPALLRQWQCSQDVDASGIPLEATDQWQPTIWRAIRSRINTESPAEQLPRLLDQLRVGAIDVDLPARLIFFGLTTFPTGNDFLDLVDAVAQRRDVYLYLLDPAPHASKRCAGQISQYGLLRAMDHTEAHIDHPLLRSWGRPYRERALLLERAKIEGRLQPNETLLFETTNRRTATSSLLKKVQFDIANDRTPDGSFILDPSDTSIQIHSCYGELRQVEAMRAAILHQLARDPTLSEENIVVLCPNINRFAPLIEAGFGPSIDDDTNVVNERGPNLRWRLSDRSLHPNQPVFTALEALLQIASNQSSVSEVLTFISLDSVSTRFNMSTDDLATIERWVEQGRVRWGFDGDQRTDWGLSRQISQGTWGELIDRLILGLALDDEIDLPPGDLAPIAVETEASDLLGRFVDLLHRLHNFIVEAGQRRSITHWLTMLQDAVSTFCATDENNRWQIDQTLELLAKVRQCSQQLGSEDIDEIFLRDIRQIVHEATDKIGGRSNFFRGGVTVTSVLPLRWIPYRVVCLLGMDEESFGIGSSIDGDDLIARAPQLGDRDARSELRQTLLEALLVAEDSCILTRTGRSINTNHDVPAATVVAELLDVLTATIDQQSQQVLRQRIIRSHSRHGFANDEFIRGRFLPGSPWSFSNANLKEAKRRLERTREDLSRPVPFQLAGEDEVTISIERLIQLIKHPIKFYYENRLQLSFPSALNELDEHLPVDLAGLEAWEVATNYIESTLSGVELGRWRKHERALGALPIGPLAEIPLNKIQTTVDAIFLKATELGFSHERKDLKEISIALPDGTEIHGTVPLNLLSASPGTLSLTYSRAKEEHHLTAWIRLMALTATEPSVKWKSIVVYRKGDKADALVLSMPDRSIMELQNQALDGLSALSDLYRRAMREPLPLFGGISQKIHNNTATPDDWFFYNGHGPGDDLINQLAFGQIGLSEVLALPVEDYDPVGASSSRTKRLADFLWDSVERTSVKE